MVIAPQTVALENSMIFVSYLQFQIGQQILMWTNPDGSIVREDTLTMGNIAFAYAEGSNVVLVEVVPGQSGVEVTLRPFAADGSALPTETLHSEAFAADVVYNGTSFHYENGQLLMLLVTQRLGTNPIEYSARIVRRINGSNEPYTPWILGPVLSGQFAREFSVGAGPWGMGIVAYIAGNNDDQEVWVQGFDNSGQTSGFIHTIPIAEGTSCNFAVPFVDNLSVYVGITTTKRPNGIDGGAFLTAFPLDEILAAEDEFIPHPSSLILSAYPNPFNAAVRLEYDLAAASNVTLKVYDLTGREVTTLLSKNLSAGSHSVLWNADQLPSGIYLARLTASDVTVTKKLVLLK